MGRTVWMAVGLGLLVLTACGGGGSTTTTQPSASIAAPVATTPSPVATSASPTATAACSPSGDELHVVAKGIDFDTDCLAVPADTPFKIELTNKDAGIQHNVNIEGDGQFFVGDLVRGIEDITYTVDPFPAGIYTFFCKIHPSEMNGQFVVA